jgi:hypothetical protein
VRKTKCRVNLNINNGGEAAQKFDCEGKKKRKTDRARVTLSIFFLVGGLLCNCKSSLMGNLRLGRLRMIGDITVNANRHESVAL